MSRASLAKLSETARDTVLDAARLIGDNRSTREYRRQIAAKLMAELLEALRGNDPGAGF